MTKKENLIVLLIVLSARTVFLFADAIFYSNKNIDTNIDTNTNQNQSDLQIAVNLDHWSAETQSKSNHPINLPTRETSQNDFNAPLQDSEDNKEETQLNQTIKDNIDNWLDSANIKITNIKNYIQDLDLLEKIYQKDENPDVLKLLLQKLLEDYQFDKAKQYIWDINILTDKSVDVKAYIYTYINGLSLTDTNSMSKFMAFVDQIRYKSLIGADDYVFYQWIAKLWDQDYEWANILFAQVKSPAYQDFVSQIDQSITKFNNQKWVPSYYKDALIALTAMKNGYFSLANKLAVDSALENWDYVLPYQVLAYSNFMTNDRDKAIENFYDLVELDISNQDKYDFYIGASYYRKGDYQESISVLSQLLNTPEYKTDAYRYLLLNYQSLDDEQKMIQIRQKLLGQNDLQESDFKTFYDVVFYKPFSTKSKHIIYNKHQQLSYDFVSMCYENFGQKNDTCLYGEVGLDVVNSSWPQVKDGLIYLAENYPQSHIFQALWDYYSYQDLDEKAKTYYLKAVSLSSDISQKDLIEKKLISEIR